MGLFSHIFGDSGVDSEAWFQEEEHTLADLLPWRTYEDGLYKLADGFGFILKVLPVCGAADIGRRMEHLFSQNYPDGAVIQIINWTSPVISPALMEFWAIRKGRGGVAERIARERSAYLGAGVYASRVRPIVTPHDRRIFITARYDGEPDARRLEALEKFRKAVISSFRDIGGAEDVEPPEFIELCSQLLHVRRPGVRSESEWNVDEPLNTQFAGGGLIHGRFGLELSGYPAMSVGVGCAQRLPPHFSIGAATLLNGVPDNPDMRPVGPVLTTMTLMGRKQTKARGDAIKKVSRLDAMMKNGMAKFTPSAPLQLEEWKRVSDEIERGAPLLDMSVTVCAYAAAEEASAVEAIEEMRKIWHGQGVVLGDETGFHLPPFLNALPFGASARLHQEMKRHSRVRVALPETAGFLAPVHGDWSGHHDPKGVLFVSRTGQLTFWNPFLSSTNFNVAIAGRSGSGKSVFMQEIAASLVSSGGRAIAVDDGRSFATTARALEGDFVTFSEDQAISINPFSLISEGAVDASSASDRDDEDDHGDDISYRTMALAAATMIGITIATDGSGRIEPFQRSMIKKAVKQAWDLKGSSASFTDVRRLLEERGGGDQRAADLADMFEDFSVGGQYEAWFEGRSDLKVKSAFTVFELGDIKQNRILKSIALQVVMFLGQELMFNSPREERVAIIVDEAWDLLDGEEMGKFIGGIARRARKHSGMLVTGTQSVMDFYANPAAEATINNSDWTVLLSQKPEALDRLRVEQKLGVSDYVRHQLGTLRMHKGAFTELAIRNADGGWAFLRLVLDPYSIAAYSSDGATVARLNELEGQGLSLEEAVDALVEEGSAR